MATIENNLMAWNESKNLLSWSLCCCCCCCSFLLQLGYGFVEYVEVGGFPVNHYYESLLHMLHTNQFNIQYPPYANAFNQWNSKEQQIKQRKTYKINDYFRYVEYSTESQCFRTANTLGMKLSWKNYFTVTNESCARTTWNWYDAMSWSVAYG